MKAKEGGVVSLLAKKIYEGGRSGITPLTLKIFALAHRCPLNMRLSGPHGRSRRCGKGKIPLLLQRFEPRSVHPVATRCIDYAFLIKLNRGYGLRC
jgi:hypothetical protein